MEDSLSLSLKVISSLALMGVVCFFVHLYNTMWFKSERQRRKLWMQGIRGPWPSFIYGNLPEMQKIQQEAARTPDNDQIVGHDYTSSLFPYFVQWRKEYGNTLPFITCFSFFFLVNELVYIDVSAKLSHFHSAILLSLYHCLITCYTRKSVWT